MPRKGYWIECIPMNNNNDKLELSVNQTHISEKQAQELYQAVISSIPDIHVVASSPDQAIDRLRKKLNALNRYYRMTGKDLPEMDNPVRPPRNLRSVQGWISVYVQFTESHA